MPAADWTSSFFEGLFKVRTFHRWNNGQTQRATWVLPTQRPPVAHQSSSTLSNFGEKWRTWPENSLMRWIPSASCSRLHRRVRRYMEETGLSSPKQKFSGWVGNLLWSGTSPITWSVPRSDAGPRTPQATTECRGGDLTSTPAAKYSLKTFWGVEPTASRKHNHPENMQRRVSPWHCSGMSAHCARCQSNQAAAPSNEGDVRCHYALQNKSETSCSRTDAALMREKRGVFPTVWILV